MLTRRSALAGTAAATAALLMQPKPGWSATATARPDIASPAGKKMVDLYGAAVKAMQDPAINYPPQPQSWTFQAYMHAVPLNPFDPANSGGVYGTALKKRVDQIYGSPASGSAQAAWKQAALACWPTCEHGSPYFTTWHRWYLYYFERICRKMSKHPEFVLPYWNYASDNGASLQLPAQFTDVSQDPDNPNALFFDDRGLGFSDAQATGAQNVAMNDGGYLPFSLAQYGPALGTKAMFPSDDQNHVSGDPTDPIYLGLGFTGRLECVPHDNVHSYIGGWMQNVPSAAGDPIFFMHHCQIDRLYASWEAQSGASYNWGNSPTQPDQTTWKTVKTASYVDENGKLVKVKLGDAINTSALNYGYDKLVPQAPIALATVSAASARPVSRLTVAAMETRNFEVRGGGTTVTLAPTAPTATAAPAPATPHTAPAAPAAPPPTTAPAIAPTAAAPRPEATLSTAAPLNGPQTLILKDIKLLRRPRAPLSVFINLPTGTAPQLNGPYYVGTLNLFNFDLGTGRVMKHSDDGGHMAHNAPKPEARFDVTEILQQQRARGQWDGGAISVTVSTIGADSPGAVTYVTIGSISLVP